MQTLVRGIKSFIWELQIPECYVENVNRLCINSMKKNTFRDKSPNFFQNKSFQKPNCADYKVDINVIRIKKVMNKKLILQ